MKTFFLFFILVCTAILFSCKKDSFITGPEAQLYTSADTLFFDTVFTTAGSVTQSFKIFNHNDQKLRLSQIKLGGGNTSAFKINVDGTSAYAVSDIVLNPNDSMYVFVQVNAPTSGSTLPFILEDSIQIDYNGNKRTVQLQAYGQNAIFLKNQVISGSVTWNDKLPYVILDGVRIDTSGVLQIQQGAKIYLHATAPFLVDGTLIADGSLEKPVIFSGDRLDADYKDLPASWPGIFFRNSSENNTLTHTIIQNAFQGIIAESLSTTAKPKVRLSGTVINNIFDAGLSGINTNIYADNSLISNCGSNVQIAGGGDYRFYNCTIVSYNTIFISHKNPVLQISDEFDANGTGFTASLNGIFQNCIIWGDGGPVDDEISVEKKGSNLFSLLFDHVLYKSKIDPANATFHSCINNTDPQFDSINISKNIFDFHLKSSSPAIEAGSASSPFPVDLDGKSYALPPDLGCYQH